MHGLDTKQNMSYIHSSAKCSCIILERQPIRWMLPTATLCHTSLSPLPISLSSPHASAKGIVIGSVHLLSLSVYLSVSTKNTCSPDPGRSSSTKYLQSETYVYTPQAFKKHVGIMGTPINHIQILGDMLSMTWDDSLFVPTWGMFSSELYCYLSSMIWLISNI